MTYQLASTSRRFVAFIIDGLLINLIAGLASFPFPWGIFKWDSYDFSLFRYSGWLFIIALIYYTISEASKSRATLGKKLMNMEVLDNQGNGLTLTKSFTRNLVKVISGNFFIIGFLFVFFTKEKQALHDLAGDTVVVEI